MSDNGQVLIADDDDQLQDLMYEALAPAGFRITQVGDGNGALAALSRGRFEVLVLDDHLPGRSGIEVLRALQNTSSAPEVVMVTGFATVETAVEAMKLGSFDFLRKPFEVADLVRTVQRAAERRRLARENAVLRRVVAQQPFAGPVMSESPSLKAVMTKIQSVAASTVPVLLTGETGTGKGLMAKQIHRLSPRSSEPFLQVNCGALQETLFESELFGHRKGAFTGAVESKQGLFEVAEGGTLFLDEVGELKPVMQAKLLQVLDTGEIRPVGGTQARTVDVRIVAATNRDLGDEVEKGNFRRDLYFRLAVVRIQLPPLRERGDDITPLLDYYLTRFRQPGKERKRFSPEAVDWLCAYSWPGNVRELANLVETAVLLAPGPVIEVSELPILPQTNTAAGPTPATPGLSLAEVERLHIIATLKQTSGLKAKAARVLGIDIKTLNRKLKSYGL